MKVFSRDNPSPRYIELLAMYREVHEIGIVAQEIPAEQTFAGQSLGPHIGIIRSLIKATQSCSILDYGSGKGSRYHLKDININGRVHGSIKEYWGAEEIRCYDPGYEPYSELPAGQMDAVVCTDVLEHIPEEDLLWILKEQFSIAKLFVYGNIACYPAKKILPDGKNAHCTVRSPEWWSNVIASAHSSSGSQASYLFVAEELTQSPESLFRRAKVRSRYSVLANEEKFNAIAKSSNLRVVGVDWRGRLLGHLINAISAG